MMLYSVGPLMLDTRPFSVNDVQRTASADFAQKPLIGTMQSREFMGEGEDRMILSGQLLPFRTGGITELEMVHAFRRSGQRLPVLRGDGRRLGWFVVEAISETHRDLMRDGVGFFIRHSITLVKVTAEGASPSILGTILSLFNATE